MMLPTVATHPTPRVNSDSLINLSWRAKPDRSNLISCGTTASSEAHGNSHIVPGFLIQTHHTAHSLTIIRGYIYDGQHISSLHQGTSESSAGFIIYRHLFASATEHSGWEREAGRLSGLGLGLVIMIMIIIIIMFLFI